MMSRRGRGRLPTTAPSKIPPPQAKTKETAISASVTVSARPYSPASFQPAESVDDSDLIISWGADLVATNVHFWARVEAARKRGYE